MAQTQTTTTSKAFTLNWKDLGKGLIVTVFSSVVAVIMPLLEKGDYNFPWTVLKYVAISSAVGYLIKNLISPAEIVITNPTPENVAAVKEGNASAVITTAPSTTHPSDKTGSGSPLKP